MKITVVDAAKQLGISALGLRCALQQEKFKVFGEAYKNGEKWSYYINKDRFEMYLRGEIGNENNQSNKIS